MERKRAPSRAHQGAHQGAQGAAAALLRQVCAHVGAPEHSSSDPSTSGAYIYYTYGSSSCFLRIAAIVAAAFEAAQSRMGQTWPF